RIGRLVVHQSFKVCFEIITLPSSKCLRLVPGSKTIESHALHTKRYIIVVCPGSAVMSSDEVGMIVLDDKVVDLVAFDPTVPLDGSHHKRRSGSRDDGIAY